MNRSRNEHTIAASCEVRGRGYWTGEHVSVVMHPAPLGSGIRLVRTDLSSRPTCPATAQHRQAAPLRTNLVCGEARFEMVEHLMSALTALEIDNCIVEVNATELPGLDGSSLIYARQLRAAGLIVQARARDRLVICERFRIGSREAWIEAAPAQQGESYFEYQLSFDDETPIKAQTFGIELAPDRYLREIAPARTFVTERQADEIRSSGLAKHVSSGDLLVIGDNGPVQNRYRFENECARHKILDLIGDLALSGIDLVGRFTSYRGGHELNGRMARELAKLSGKLSTGDSIPPVRDRRKAA